jgi:hypothetical protein
MIYDGVTPNTSGVSVSGKSEIRNYKLEILEEPSMSLPRAFSLALFLALAAASARAGEAPAEKIPLRLDLKKGATYSLQSTHDRKISQDSAGRKQTVSESHGQTLSFKIFDVDGDRVASGTVTYTAVKFTQDGPLGKIDYDSSAQPAAKPADLPVDVRAFAALVDKSFTVRLSRRGRVKEIKGADALASGVVEAMGLAEGPVKTAAKEAVKSQFSDQALKESLETIFAVYPAADIAPGDSWESILRLSSAMPAVVDTTCKFSLRKDGVAVVNVSASITPNAEAASVKLAGANLRRELSGEQKGTIELDEKTGWPVRVELKQTLKETVSAEGAKPDQAPASAMTVESSITMAGKAEAMEVK